MLPLVIKIFGCKETSQLSQALNVKSKGKRINRNRKAFQLVYFNMDYFSSNGLIVDTRRALFNSRSCILIELIVNQLFLIPYSLCRCEQLSYRQLSLKILRPGNFPFKIPSVSICEYQQTQSNIVDRNRLGITYVSFSLAFHFSLVAIRG